MKATFVLTPAEARRLIAKAVIQTPEFQKAWKDAYAVSYTHLTLPTN